MSQHYSDPARADDPHALPDVEVFWVADGEINTEINAPSNPDAAAITDSFLESGWYYWFCFPGCLPDSDPVGPFATEAEALADARQGVE